MKCIVVFNLLFLLGVSQAQIGINEETDLATATQLEFAESFRIQGKRKAFRRIARSVFSFGQDPKTIVEKAIINNCKANGQNKAAEKLQPIFDEMKECLRKKRIFLTPRKEYLAFIEECRRESVNQSKSCLAESQRFFPDLQLKISKTLYNFLYDDYEIISKDIVKCLPKLKNEQVATNLRQCMREVAVRTKKSSGIPDSKEEFCQTFVPAASCFSDMIKDNCEQTPGTAKFREDYIKVHKQVCEEN